MEWKIESLTICVSRAGRDLSRQCVVSRRHYFGSQESMLVAAIVCIWLKEGSETHEAQNGEVCHSVDEVWFAHCNLAK